MDHLTPERRSANMAKVRGKNTKPEVLVRKLAHGLGLRFRLHRKDLPGQPDLVFPKHRLAVFVHGCFWHQHDGCKRATVPSSNRDFWVKKLAATRARDAQQAKDLRSGGWEVLTVWECELKDETAVADRLVDSVRRGSKRHSKA